MIEKLDANKFSDFFFVGKIPSSYGFESSLFNKKNSFLYSGIYYTEIARSSPLFAIRDDFNLQAATIIDNTIAPPLKDEIPVRWQQGDSFQMLRPSTIQQLNNMKEFKYAEITDFIYNEKMLPVIKSNVIQLRIYSEIMREMVKQLWIVSPFGQYWV